MIEQNVSVCVNPGMIHSNWHIQFVIRHLASQEMCKFLLMKGWLPPAGASGTDLNSGTGCCKLCEVSRGSGAQSVLL